MNKIFLAPSLLLICITGYLNAQKTAPSVQEEIHNYSYIGTNTSAIRGIITDENKDPLPGAVIVLLENGSIFKGVITDIDGSYQLDRIPDGTYDLKVTYMGYQEKVIEGLQIKGQNADYERITLIEMDITPICVCAVDYEEIRVESEFDKMMKGQYSEWQAERMLQLGY